MTAQSPSLPRNTRRKRRNRARLTAAARLVMSRKGIEAATIAEITAEADLALGTFYNYFPSKEAILEAVVSETIERLADDIDALTANVEDAAVVLATALRHTLRRAGRDPIWAGFVVRNRRAGDVLAEQLEHRARRDVQRGVESGRFEVVEPDAVLTALGGIVMAGIKDTLPDMAQVSQEGLVCCALQMLGVPAAEAARIVAEPLPDLPSQNGQSQNGPSQNGPSQADDGP